MHANVIHMEMRVVPWYQHDVKIIFLEWEESLLMATSVSVKTETTVIQ